MLRWVAHDRSPQCLLEHLEGMANNDGPSFLRLSLYRADRLSNRSLQCVQAFAGHELIVARRDSQSSRLVDRIKELLQVSSLGHFEQVQAGISFSDGWLRPPRPGHIVLKEGSSLFLVHRTLLIGLHHRLGASTKNRGGCGVRPKVTEIRKFGTPASPKRPCTEGGSVENSRLIRFVGLTPAIPNAASVRLLTAASWPLKRVTVSGG